MSSTETERTLIEAGRLLVADLELDSVLENVLLIARKITGARYAALGVVSKDGLRLESFFVNGIEKTTSEAIGDLPKGKGLLGLLMREGQTVRVADISAHPASVGFPQHHPVMKTFLGVPIVIKERVYGNLYLTEKEHGMFTDEDQEAVITLASWAAIAINNARSITHERLAQSIVSAEQERARWARELHDGVLQSLAAARVVLTAALSTGQPKEVAQAATYVTGQLEHDIQDLRALITDLRPAILDTFGLIPALEDLVERAELRSRISVSFSADTRARQQLEHAADPELETAIYRVIQEALTNALKHAGARSVAVTMTGQENSLLQVVICDDGQGFDLANRHNGAGLVGMRERAELVQGTLHVISQPQDGTKVTFLVKTKHDSRAQTVHSVH